MKNFTRRRVLRAAVHLGLVAVVVPSAARAQDHDPSNRLAVIIDGSGSFRTRVDETIKQVVSLLSETAEAKIKRWEPDSDRITIISLDALPGVLWQGSLRQLKEIEPADWTQRFQARTDYAGCTDVGAAFRLAARALEGDPRYVAKYLWAFTDLIDEPPTTSVRKCVPPRLPSLPPVGFPWEALRDVSVSVFWLPAEQVLAWRREVATQGLDESFTLYAASESGTIAIKPPPRPIVHLTDEERAAQRSEYLELAWTVGTRAATLMGVLVLGFGMLVGGAFLSRRLRARQAPRRPAPPLSALRPRGPRGVRPLSRPLPRQIRPRPPSAGNGQSA